MQRRDAILALGGILASPGVFRLPRRAAGLGVQLYTLRTAMAADLEGTLARVAGIGYREVEFAGYFDRPPAEIRRILDANGLRAPAAHVGIDAVTTGYDATIAAARTLGHQALVVPSLPRELSASLDGYRRAAAMLGEAADRAASAGIAIGYHNHDAEFATLEGAQPFDVFVDALPPNVFLELDVFWAAKGGSDPVALMKRLGERVRMIHAKDMNAAGEMVDVGAGRLDFAAIIAAGGSHLQHVFVEHDHPADAFASVRAGFAHLQPLLS